MGSPGACESLCLVGIPGGWILTYHGFVLPGDMNEKGLKVAKDPSPESVPGHTWVLA